MRTVAQAVAAAIADVRSGTYFGPGMCDHVVGTYWGLGASGFATSKVHSSSTPGPYRHGWSSAPPVGASVFWDSLQGHTAMSVGGGKIITTDLVRLGRVNVVGINDIHTHWGLTPLFWSDAWFGSQGVVKVTATPPPPIGPPQPLIHLSYLQVGLRNWNVTLFQNALRAHGMARYNPSGATGFYGAETTAMCQHFYNDVLHLPGPHPTPGLGGVGALGFVGAP